MIKLTTKIYGQSDDNIYTEGDYSGQYAYYGTDEQEHGILLVINDGTILEIKYGKGDLAIWGIQVIKKGILFDRIEYCDNEDANIYSDIVFLKEGIKFIYACSDWEKIK